MTGHWEGIGRQQSCFSWSPCIGEEGKERGIREGRQENREAWGHPRSMAQVEGMWRGKGQEENLARHGVHRGRWPTLHLGASGPPPTRHLATTLSYTPAPRQ